MKSSIRLCAVLAAMLSLAWAQLFGLQKNYLCLCAGEPVETAADHCHGPHTMAADHHDLGAPHR